MLVVLSIIFWSLAAFMNAVEDKLQFHFYNSIFKHRKHTFWNPEISWDHSYVIPYTKYKVDAWHLAKSLRIIFCVLSIIFFNPEEIKIHLVFVVILYGALWNLVFNTCFNHLLDIRSIWRNKL
jgi:hypothetical protein